jgi:hypothetical protein
MFRAGRDQFGIPPPRVNRYRDWNLIVEIRALFSLDGLDGVGASAFFRFRLATDRNKTYLAQKKGLGLAESFFHCQFNFNHSAIGRGTRRSSPS